MTEETKITHEALDNLNEAIKSDQQNKNKPTKYLNVAGVYKTNNQNYTRPLRTDEFGNLKIVKESNETQEVTNPTLTNLNKTINNNAINVNVNNLESLNITDEFGEKQNLSAFQTVSKGTALLEGDASTFPKLLVHNVRPETTPVVNQTDKNNDIIPLNCNVDNTLQTGRVIKPLQSTIRALPASASADPNKAKNSPNNQTRNEIMADSDYENALQTVDQNLKTVLGAVSVVDNGKLKTEDQNLTTVFGSASVHDTGKLKTEDQNLTTVFGSASVHDTGKLKTEDQTLKTMMRFDTGRTFTVSEVNNAFARIGVPVILPFGQSFQRIWEYEAYLVSDWNIKVYLDTTGNYPNFDERTKAENNQPISGDAGNYIYPYKITNDKHNHVRIFGYCKYDNVENEGDPYFWIMGSTDDHHYYNFHKVDKNEFGTIKRVGTFDTYILYFNLVIEYAPKYILFKNSDIDEGNEFIQVYLHYSKFI